MPDSPALTPPTSITFSVRITADKDPRGPKGSLTPVSEPFAIPTDYAVLHDIVQASRTFKAGQKHHVGAMAMGLCCPGLTRKLARQDPPITYESYNYLPIPFGRRVYSWLVGQGANPPELGAALDILYPLCLLAGFPPDESVVAALGKSPGPGES